MDKRFKLLRWSHLVGQFTSLVKPTIPLCPPTGENHTPVPSVKETEVAPENRCR